MLNRFRIGTKLTLGFFIVLVLLVVIWLVGRLAINQKTIMAGGVEAGHGLTQAGLTFQRDVFEAMNAANMRTITRDGKYAEDVRNMTAKIIAAREKDLEGVTDKDMLTMMQGVLDKLTAFAQANADAWQSEVKRKQAAEERCDLAEQMVERIEELKDTINRSTIDQSIIQEGETYYLAKRVERVNIAETIDSKVRDIRRMSFQYELASKNIELKMEVRKSIDRQYTHIAENIAGLKERLERKMTQDMLEELNEKNAEWRAAVLLSMELEDEYAILDVRSTKYAGELIAAIEGLFPIFEGIAKGAKDADLRFNDVIQWTLTIVSLIAIFLGVIVSLVLGRNIGSGIRAAASATKHIAETGDLDIEIPREHLESKDEIGDLARAVSTVLTVFQNVAALSKALAEGNWQTDVQIRGDLDLMNQDLSAMLARVNQTLREIDDNIQHVAIGSGEVSATTHSLSSGAQQAAASLEAITTSMNEISNQTKQNAESANQARDLAQTASKAAAEGQGAMQEMTEAMGRITQNSNEIQRVIKVIDDIAFQTNLLALNAAVEAARAGQHGKGFAVVAEEVRNLASRSAKAAQETSELIAKSGQEIERGGEVASHTAEILNTIVEQIKQTTDLVAGIAVASNEQAQGVNQVSIGLQQIDSVTQQNTASAEESASAANEMSAMAANLQKLVAQFKLR
ncbi:MAG: methyl-accepting chemotaxis protein [Planctomycetaceae bacterium]|nr:methyl-accepting chemotaxis protein [Planctomycetaceae bacterium]